MGSVFLAEDPRLGRKVALKKVVEGRNRNQKARERLRREARAAAQLSHPNIASIFDVVEDGGEFYVVMEYVDGVSLDKVVGERRLQTEEVRQIGIQLADALEAAHSSGIIHRDIKPSNVALRTDGRVKLLDFGLARMDPRSSESQVEPLTGSNEVMGTYAYLAPEVLAGSQADERSDLYSLGVVLYELATGARFRRRHGSNRRTEKLEALESRPDASASVVVSAIRKATSPDPQARFQDSKALRQALSETSLELALTRTRGRLRTTLATQRWLPRWSSAATAGGTLLLITAGLAFYLSSAKEDVVARPRAVAVLPLVNATGEPSLDPVCTGIAYTLIAKLTRVSSLTTVSRAATLEHTANADVPTIARELGVDYVVLGTMQRSSARLQITVNLIAEDDSVVWGDVYQGEETQLFELQRRIALGLVDALRLRLSPPEREFVLSVPTTDREAYAEYSQGRAFLERLDLPGNLDHAETLFQSARERDPGFVEALAALGETYWARYRATRDATWAERAWEVSERAANQEQDNPAVLFSLALTLHGTGRADAAVETLKRLIAIQPNHDDAHALLGEIYSDRGNIEPAVDAFQRSIAIRPNFWRHHRALGLAYFHAGEVPKAIAAFRRITELLPDSPSGFQLVGLAHHSNGDLESALSNYRRAIALGPNPAALSNVGTIHYRQGEYQKAAAAYQEAIELRPNSPGTYRNLGDAYRRLGQQKEAEEAYLTALELMRERLDVNPKNARNWGMLAVYEAKLGREVEATIHAEEALELAPLDAHVSYSAAVVYSILGRTQEALELLTRAAEQGHSRSEIAIDDDFEILRDRPEYQKLVGSN